jgi:hypothetical protein
VTRKSKNVKAIADHCTDDLKRRVLALKRECEESESFPLKPESVSSQKR